MESVKLRFGCKFTVEERGEISLIELLPEENRQYVGKVELVNHSRFCSNIIVTWTGLYYSIFSIIPELSFLKLHQLDVTMNAIAPDASITLAVFGHSSDDQELSIGLMDISESYFSIIRNYSKLTTENVLSIGFSEMRYQAFVLTENSESISDLVSSDEEQITTQSIEKRFHLNNVKFKFFISTEHLHFILLEEPGLVIGFNTEIENLEEFIRVDKAFAFSLPMHKKFKTQKSVLLRMATERQLTNIEFRFTETF